MGLHFPVIRQVAVLGAVVVLYAGAAVGPGVRPAHAQGNGTQVAADPADPFDQDPLSEGDTADLGHVKVPKAAPKPPSMVTGSILTALPGVKITSEDARVILANGLAWVTTTVVLTNGGVFPSDVTWRVTAPRASGLASVAACRPTCVVDGALKDKKALLVSDLGATYEAGMKALAPKETARLRMTYVAETATHGGVLRFVLPAQGRDARLDEWTVTTETKDGTAVDVEGVTGSGATAALAPWLPARIRVTGARNARAADRFPCDGQSCTRKYVALPAGPSVGGVVTVLLDASPSTEGPARSRMMDAVVALLAGAPPGVRMRFVAFGARAEAVGDLKPRKPDAIALADLTGATERALGAATRIASAWTLLEDAHAFHPGERWVLLGDGGLSTGAANLDTAGRLKVRGVALTVVNLADRDATPALLRFAARAGGTALSLAQEADAARREADDTSLSDALSSVFAKQPSAGEGITTWAKAGGPPPHPTENGLALARLFEARRAPPTSADLGKGIPAETVLSMLRDRVIPVARQCFRQDRRGRGDYAVNATYEFALADREVVSAKVVGAVDERLRQCLATAVDTLDVPRFTGTVVIRYPVRTLREAPAPVITLSNDVAKALDGLVTDEDRHQAANPRLSPDSK